MKVDAFDFTLSEDLIAQFPLANRGDSRMLYVNQHQTPAYRDSQFRDLPDFLQPGDVIVLNDTRVIKARLSGYKITGGKVEVMIERVLDAHHARALIRASHAPTVGSTLQLEPDIEVQVMAREADLFTLHFLHPQPLLELLDQYGEIPLPPYIGRAAEHADEQRYQTVFAQTSGAVAAPTAGLHFDDAMLSQLRTAGVHIASITLHVGAGTFQPVRTENTEDHIMHTEQYHIPETTAQAIQTCKAAGHNVIAVGTTSLRALEGCIQAHNGQLTAGWGETNLFITPGFRFQVVDKLLTNFHLPRSTLFMLISAFAGMSTARTAYQHAIDSRYRFFSYGDAMFIDGHV